MTPATRRVMIRWFHIAMAVPIAGYIYTPFEALEGFAWLIRWYLLPALVLSGLWMWKGHVVRRMITGGRGAEGQR